MAGPIPAAAALRLPFMGAVKRAPSSVSWFHPCYVMLLARDDIVKSCMSFHRLQQKMPVQKGKGGLSN